MNHWKIVIVLTAVLASLIILFLFSSVVKRYESPQSEIQNNIQIRLVEAEPEQNIEGGLRFSIPRRWDLADIGLYVGFDGLLKKADYYEPDTNQYRTVKPNDEEWNLWNNERWPEVRQEATTGKKPESPSQ